MFRCYVLLLIYTLRLPQTPEFVGLGDCQEAYSPYPNALLSLRFIISVGKIIMADALVEPGEVKEGDNMSMSKPRTPLSRPSAVSNSVCYS